VFYVHVFYKKCPTCRQTWSPQLSQAAVIRIGKEVFVCKCGTAWPTGRVEWAHLTPRMRRSYFLSTAEIGVLLLWPFAGGLFAFFVAQNRWMGLFWGILGGLAMAVVIVAVMWALKFTIVRLSLRRCPVSLLAMPVGSGFFDLFRDSVSTIEGAEQGRMAQIQQTYGEDKQHVATLTLAEYRSLLSAVPLPSTQQKSEFAEFVSTAHSWYKHLPPNLPGQPFYFFIDKYAGCDRLLREDGTAVVVERTERGFHYSDLPTKEYRSRFGYLAFSCSSGTSVFVANWPLVYSRDKVAAVPGDDGKMYGIPKEILEVGETHLTAIIHPGGSCYPVCNSLKDWPQESGGRIALEKIATRCREMQDPKNPRWQLDTRSVGYTDPLLDNLVVPERQRQKREIVRSVGRVCEVIRGGRDHA
jgi:hypothetical protein